MKSFVKFFVFIFVLFSLFFAQRLSASGEDALVSDRDTRISMDLQDAPLKAVMKLLSIQSGLNFIASEGVQDRTITLYLDKVPLKEAMDKIFKANNLSYDMDEETNIFIVNDWGKPTTQTITKVFYLKHATVSSSSLMEELKNNKSSDTSNTDTGASSSSNTSSSSSSGYSSTNSTDTGKWKVEENAGITQVVKKLLSESGSVIEDFRTNSLTVTDTPARMEIVGQVIASLDISVPEVMLEVEILDVSKNIVDNIGFKFGQTPLSVAITGATATMGYPYHSWAKGSGAYGSIDINNANTAGGAYKAQLDFLRIQTDTKFLARPKILTLNNETAEVKITTDEAIGVTSVTEGQGTSSSTTTTAERFETGVSLRVTPQIDLETGEITMFVYPQVSEASTTSASFTSNGQTYTFLNPEVRSTKTSVRVKDGETVVLGGLIRNQNTTVITKLPILGDIPLLGALFRHKSQSPGRDRELLVFITPHIMKSDKTDLASAKKAVLPLREQAKAIPLTRQQSVKAYLNNFETGR